MIFILITYDNVSLGKALFIRTSFSISHSESLWLLGDEKTPYKGTNLGGSDIQANRVYYEGGLDNTLSLNSQWDIHFGIKYGYVKLNDAPFLGAQQNESRNQISSATLGTSYHIFQSRNKLFGAFLKYTHPGESKRQKPAFLSFNDFSSYLEPGFYGSFYFRKWEYHPLIKYKHKISGIGNHHAAFENKTFYNFSNRFKFGPGIDFLTTSGGRDIADEAFLAYLAETNLYPVWNKKEKWVGLSAIGAYRLKNNLIFDFYIHRKIMGSNTDIATTLAVGIGKEFDL